MVAYPRDVVLLNITHVCRRRLRNEGYTLLGILAVSNADGEEVPSDAQLDQSAEELNLGDQACASLMLLHDYLTSTSTVDGRGLRRCILHIARRESLRPLIIHRDDIFPVL